MLIICASAGGSPGVTTSALGLTMTWPRDVLLADCDPHPNQAVLAGYLRGVRSDGRGLGMLAEHYRAQGFDGKASLLEQTLVLSEGREHGCCFLPGFTHPRQPVLFTDYWPRLADQFDECESAGMDIIIDAGRLTSAGLPEVLVERCAVVLVVARSQLRSLACVNLALPELTRAVPGDRLKLVVIGGGRPYSASEAAKQLKIPLAAGLPWDPVCSGVLSDGDTPGRKLSERPLWRGLVNTAMTLSGLPSSHALRIRAETMVAR